MVGASIGRSLAWGLGIPAIGVHHMEGHLLAPMLEDGYDNYDGSEKKQSIKFPFVALLVSGGHTMLVQVKSIGDYTIMGESVDDAVGEAFDKTAKMLGLAYPGGPVLAALAEQGEADVYQFPRPMVTWKNSDQTEQDKANIAYAFQEAVVDTLFIKCKRALKSSEIERLVIAGGVGANKRLREKLGDLKAEVFAPPMKYCTDNGAMIAYAGAIRIQAGQAEEAKFTN